MSNRLYLGCLLLACTSLFATDEETAETIDEITVLGVRDLGELRAELVRAEDEVYEMFNTLNEDDDYGVMISSERNVNATKDERDRKRQSGVDRGTSQTAGSAAEV
jgi:hypothetical protein